YRRALKHGIETLHNFPLSLRFIKEIHRVLMDGVRGKHKNPGEFRRIPNWIGPPRSTLETARYIPIEASKLIQAMGQWEKFIHTDFPDALVQLAIIHAEFEALHPFLDGNGRLGRILIPLFLWNKKLINHPMFYLSAYLEANRQEYY